MMKMCRRWILGRLLLAVLCAGSVWAGRVSEPVRCSGRIGTSAGGNPVLYWSGSSIQARFEGSSLSIVLKDTGKTFYNVIIDGQDARPVVLDLEPGEQTYAVASNLTDGVHSVQLYRRTEGTDGPTEFMGFLLDEGAGLLAPPEAPRRRIAFFGDSITCGMGNEAPDDAKDHNNAERNHYMTYGSIAARELGAELHCVARSGIGIVKSWYDLVMPDYWYRLDPADSQSRWDFSAWTPDVVVVNLFQNDIWLVKRMAPEPTEEQIIQAYIEFVSGIRSVYPEAHIVCALGCMDATRPGSPWPGYIEEAVRRLNDEQMSVLIFPFTGWTKHPRVRHHRAMADLLVGHLRAECAVPVTSCR
jgi:hypothetical protein